MGRWSWLGRIFPAFAASAAMAPAAGAATPPEDAAAAKAWKASYDAREAWYRAHIGEFPEDILKMGNLIGVWPGGGLFVMGAGKLGKDLHAYTTFGLSNTDMPASGRAEDVQLGHHSQGRLTSVESKLTARTPATTAAGDAGYGYELLVLTRGDAEWPLWILQWAANAEIGNDVGLLKRVEKYAGLTVQDIRVGEGASDVVHILFAKAQPPLPAGTVLPNGRMQLLIATVITRDEMEWSMTNGRDQLLAKLAAAGVGQVSDRHRKSVLQ